MPLPGSKSGSTGCSGPPIKKLKQSTLLFCKPVSASQQAVNPVIDVPQDAGQPSNQGRPEQEPMNKKLVNYLCRLITFTVFFKYNY